MPQLPTFDATLAESHAAHAIAQATQRGEPLVLVVTAPWQPVGAAELLAVCDAPLCRAWLGARAAECFAAIGQIEVVQAAGAGRFAALRSAIQTVIRRMESAAVGGAAPRVARFFGGFSFAGTQTEHEAWAGWPAAEFALPAAIFGRDAEGFFQQRLARVEAGDTVADVLGRLARPSLPEPATIELPVVDGLSSAVAFEDEVRAMVAAIESGRLQKAVAARRETQPLSASPPLSALLGALADHNPAATTFAFRAPGRADFVGASPERLVRVAGRELKTVALAGTARRVTDLALDEQIERLRNSAKDRAEHGWVAEAIRAALHTLGESVPEAGEPDVRVLPDLLHLERRFAVTLRPEVDVFDALAALHPTPAVGGVPVADAAAMIAQHEGAARGWYAGGVGWISARLDADLVVALRSALVAGNRALLFAGAGIVAGSVAERELAETRAKMLPMQRALAAATRSQ